MMKLTFALIMISLFHVSASVYSQNAKVDLNVERTKISNVLKSIERQLNFSYRFVYNADEFPAERRVTIDVSKKPLNEVLQTMLEGTGYRHQLLGEELIVLTPLNGRPLQLRRITGIVKDSLGAVLSGVSVRIKGSSKGTTTGDDGGYALEVPQGTTLEFSYVGYMSQEIALSDQSTTVNVVLQAATSDLDEVVVVGYGTQRKGNITGAVGSLTVGDDIAGRPSSEIGQSLYGQVAGVQVISSNGSPGASTTIQIRGVNSVSAGSAPLIVVDGIPAPNYDLNLVNNADVESIQILKDAASAAIYGSRGANGVVLITTKKGKAGTSRLDVNYVSGIQHVIDKVPVMNAVEYAQAAIDAAQASWVESGGDPDAPNTIAARGHYRYTWPTALENPETLPNTDFQDVVFRTAPLHRVDLSVTGGSERNTFRISGGIVDRKGIVVNSDYSRYAMSFNATSKLTEWLEIGGGTNLNYDQEEEPYYRTVEWAVQYPSIYPVYSENGYLGAPLNQPGFENYNAILFRPQNGHPLYRSTDDIRRNRFNGLGNIYGQLNLVPGLTFKSVFNYYYRRADNSNYEAVDHLLGPAYYTEGAMAKDHTQVANYTFQNLLTYERSIERHHFSALVGSEYYYNELRYSYLQRRGYDNDLVKALSAGRTVYAAEDRIAKSALISYFARANYDYDGKYLVSASIRRDGSSRFAPANRWGYFPSVSVGWLVSEEHFLAELEALSTFKLRASYGLTGNDRFDDYRWIGQISQGRAALGNGLLTTYYPSSITNPDLKWERTRQFNAGLDLGFLHERFQLTADYYRSTSDGLLLEVPVPVVSGFTSVFKNIGEIENKGWELSLTSHNIKNDRFTWSSNFNISTNRNTIRALGPDNAPMILSGSVASGMQKINQVGEEAFSFFGYVYDGVYLNQAAIDADPAAYPGARPGDGRYRDVDGNGVLNENDRTVIGKVNPDFIWGFTNRLSYKGIDLSFVFQGVQGIEIMDENVHRSLLYHEGRNYLKSLTNRWRSEEEPGDGYHYKLKVDENGYEKTPSSYWLFDGSYIRLKDITLGYALPYAAIKRIGLSSARIYFNGSNLLTHKEAPVIDPEGFSGDVDDASRRGVHGNPYPAAKIYSLGLTIGL